MNKTNNVIKKLVVNVQLFRQKLINNPQCLWYAKCIIVFIEHTNEKARVYQASVVLW